MCAITTLNLQVAASTDDAREWSDGSMYLTEVAILFGAASHFGLRFTSVSGLAGATIGAVTLRFKASGTDSGAFIGDWYGQDGTASPTTFTTTAYNITGRTKTTATCEGDGSDFGSWTAGTWYDFTGDGVNTIAGIIQELANSYDPTAIVLVWIRTSGTGYRRPYTWDYNDHASAPKLDIDYSTGVDATVLAVTAEATADAPLPTITTTRSPTISAVAAVATADALLPTISAVRNPTVSAVVATADADALIPTVEGTTGGVNATVLAVTAEAAAACPLPTVTAIRNPTVLAVTATATAGALLPTISTTRSPTVLAVAAEAIAAAPLPTITTVRSPTVLAVTAEATAAALLPTVAAIRNATVLALTAEAAATCLLPTITTVRSPTVLAVTATATAAALIPTITVGILYADWDIIVSIDPTLYPASATITFVAVIWTSDGGHGVYARLYNITDAEEVASSVVSTAEIAATELVSGPLSLPQASRAYRAEWGGVAGATYKMSSARILVTV